MSGTEPPPLGPGPEPEWEPPWDTEPQPTAAPPPRTSPRSHRAPLAVNQRLARLLAPITAVAAVIIVILLLIWINGRSPSGTSSAAAVDATSQTPPKVISATHTGAATPPPSTRTKPPATPKPTPTPTPVQTSPSAHPSKPAHPNRAAATAMAPVQVLNNSRRTGLAHEVAAEVADRGWHVGIIGNLQGEISEPTVYYSAGEKAAAEHLAHEFSSIQRVEPNSAAGLSATGITLVLTADWVS